MSDNVWFVGRPRPLALPLVELEEKPPVLKILHNKIRQRIQKQLQNK